MNISGIKSRQAWGKMFLFTLALTGVAYCAQPENAAEQQAIVREMSVGLNNPPLTEEGLVDYIKYFNTADAKGVTPENNFVNAFIDIMGVEQVNEPIRDEFFRLTGYKMKGDGKGVWVNMWSQNSPFKVPYEQMEPCGKHLWMKAQYPEMAQYVQANSRALDMLAAAANRSEYYAPFLKSKSLKYEAPPLGSTVFTLNINKFREGSFGLRYRALMLAGEGNIEAAWNDVIAGRKYGLLVLRGNTKSDSNMFLNQLVGVAMLSITDETASVIVGEAIMTAEQISKFRKAWQGCATPKLTGQMLWGMERYYALDAIAYAKKKHPVKYMVDSQKMHYPAQYPFMIYALQTSKLSELLEQVNNIHTIRMAATDISNISPEYKKYVESVNLAISNAKSGWSYCSAAKFWMPAKKLQELLAEMVCVYILEYGEVQVDKVKYLFYMEQAKYEIVNMGLAVREYQLTTGKYPEKLAELVPGYFKELPKDPFSDKDYIYTRTPHGFRLYSIGGNLKDDGGIDDRKDGDIVFEIPAAEKRIKK